MKCLILAGGKGNSLWPLSREKYPKQFMEIKPHRSLLQETIARNIPFCEEFIISTHADYHFIVDGQMEKFQGLKYRCFLEEESRMTAPAIAMACMTCNPSELIFVVSADQMIEGENYKDTIIKATDLARQGYIVTLGMKMQAANTSFGYIRHKDGNVLEFKEKPDEATVQEYMKSGEYLWNSGNLLFRAGDFLHELDIYAPELYKKCKNAVKHINTSGQTVIIKQEVLKDIPAVSIEHALIEKSKNIKVIEPDFRWVDVSNMEALASYVNNSDSPEVIEKNCENVTVVNRCNDKLVVTNKLKDLMVVNTEDAVYITQKGEYKDVKEIMSEYHKQYSSYFENQTTFYKEWGNYKLLQKTEFYQVKMVTIYPGKTQAQHQHDLCSEQWSVVKGTATVTLGQETREYHTKDSMYVPMGVMHEVANLTDEEVVIIEISIGEVANNNGADASHMKKHKFDTSIVKLDPAFKDYLWGGTKLKDIYHKKCDYDIVAESWELSSHKDGQSVIAEGRYKGMLFGEYIKKLGAEGLGWKCQAFERFPILIKLIDAQNPLSIQVHPNDDFALREENEYGKNELWYIVDCDEGASIYYGVNQNITKEELKERVENNTVLEILNKVEVHKGDTFFVRAGMIHAIGAGILICEIQQNSNCTYRLYDYDRRDKYGNPRELHLEKARQVATLEVQNVDNDHHQLSTFNGYEVEELASCKYFVCNKYTVSTEAVVEVDETSFCSILILEGEGVIKVDDKALNFKPADSFFVPAGKKKVIVQGNCTFVQTHV